MNRKMSRNILNWYLLVLVAFSLGLCAPFQSLAQDETKDTEKTATAEKDEAEKSEPGYQFKDEIKIPHTEIKSQDATGTCWCFATASFIESELMREEKGNFDLAEMHVVRNVYKDKARNFVLRQGKANFSEGALAHDYINAVRDHGLVPQSAYSGLLGNAQRHSHGEMAGILKSILEGVVANKNISSKWKNVYDRVLDTYLGEVPKEFTFQGETYTPQTFAKKIGFNAQDYVSLTSYTHHPFYDEFVLEIPDNYSSGAFYNVPIDKLVAIIDHAVANGYSVAWDGDVSERGFSAPNGMAILPAKNRRDMFREPGEELTVDQEMRQETFENFSTTDDHLMHLVGTATDKNGTKYYVIKNSWGSVGPFEGKLYMSEAYVRLKTVSILLHKDAIPNEMLAD